MLKKFLINQTNQIMKKSQHMAIVHILGSS